MYRKDIQRPRRESVMTSSGKTTPMRWRENVGISEGRSLTREIVMTSSGMTTQAKCHEKRRQEHAHTDL